MRFFVLLILTLIVLFSCQNSEIPSEEPLSDDYISVDIKYSTGFKIWQNNEYYKIEVRNPQDGSELMGSYFLSKNGGDFGRDTIGIPVSNAAINSTTFASYFDALREVESVKGGTYLDRMMNPRFKRSFENGKITELTSAGSIDFEKVLALNPEIFMVYDFGDSNFDRIEAQGIPVIFNMEYMESTPLGRVEWIKLVGCLTGKLDESISIFDSVSNRYNDLKNLVSANDSAPYVFTGSRYKDFWYAPGNDSYIAQFIRDAGGQYVFDQHKGNGSVELEYESALQQISDADFWGMVVYEDGTFGTENLAEMSSMYKSFKAYQEGNVFVCNAAQTDFFGDAIMQPDVILSDLISIFHPALLPNHEAIYFYDMQP